MKDPRLSNIILRLWFPILWAASGCGGAVIRPSPSDTVTHEELIQFGEVATARIASGALDESEQALLAGDLDRAGELVAAAFPEESIASEFFVANLLFPHHPAMSLPRHEDVMRYAPHLPEVAFEWGMELHRAGRCEEAIGPYQVAFDDGENAPIAALLAHCLLTAGQTAEAVEAFSRAGYSRYHTQIERWFFDVLGGDPWNQRAVLIQNASTRPTAWIDVVLFDLSFPSDWWNERPSRLALTYDMERARESLGAGSASYSDLSAVVDWRLNGTSMDTTTYRSNLPTHWGIAAHVLESQMEGGMTSAQALESYGPSLNASVVEGDQNALRILAFLSLPPTEGATAEQVAELDRLDRIGCFQHHLSRYCASLLLPADPLSPDSDQLLEEVAAVLPEHHPGMSAYRLWRSVMRGEVTEEALVTYLIDRPLRMPSSMGWAHAFRALGALLRDGTVTRLDALAAALQVELMDGWL
jgi:hypothetical protein